MKFEGIGLEQLESKLFMCIKTRVYRKGKNECNFSDINVDYRLKLTVH
jgi:hypothetical protein